jgi:hypothetical protein
VGSRRDDQLADDDAAEGWYRDPYGVHEARWISSGHPTGLVRDGHSEGQDDPPDREPTRPFVPVPDATSSRGGRDFLRADDAERQPIPDPSVYSEAATDASVMGPVVSTDLNTMFETPYERKMRKRARSERWRARFQRWGGKDE